MDGQMSTKCVPSVASEWGQLAEVTMVGEMPGR